MKTLFALLTGAVLGTGVALWLAARASGDDAAAPAHSPNDAVPSEAAVSEEALT